MCEASRQEDNLNADILACPQCHTLLYRVDLSPMATDWILYCEYCAHRVVVSWYDPRTIALRDATPHHADWWGQFFTHIEDHLKPCTCGGRFRFAAPRRCYHCLTPVLIHTPGVDLWPAYYNVGMDERDPTQEEIERVEAFEEACVRRNDIWL